MARIVSNKTSKNVPSKSSSKKGTAVSPAPSSSKAAKPGKRQTGKTTSLKISPAWAHIFNLNEKTTRAGRMTDEGIQKWMRSEFPGRTSKEFTDVSLVNKNRIKFNAGGITGTLPAVRSVRYGKDGEVLSRVAANSAKGGKDAKPASASKAAKPAKGGKATGESKAAKPAGFLNKDA